MKIIRVRKDQNPKAFYYLRPLFHLSPNGAGDNRAINVWVFSNGATEYTQEQVDVLMPLLKSCKGVDNFIYGVTTK